MGSEQCGWVMIYTKGASEKQHPHSRPPSSSGRTFDSPGSVPAPPGAWSCSDPVTGNSWIVGTSLSRSQVLSLSKSSSRISLSFPFPMGVLVLVAFVVKGGTSDSISVASWM